MRVTERADVDVIMIQSQYKLVHCIFQRGYKVNANWFIVYSKGGDNYILPSLTRSVCNISRVTDIAVKS